MMERGGAEMDWVSGRVAEEEGDREKGFGGGGFGDGWEEKG